MIFQLVDHILSHAGVVHQTDKGRTPLGMRDVATVFAANNPKTKVFDGKTLTLGGSCSREAWRKWFLSSFGNGLSLK